MPIIDLQRRLREAGRIRLGERVPTQKGGTRPSKLSEFRFTSQDKRTLDFVASVYGGTVQPWESAPTGENWELYTTSHELNVIVPPVDLAWSQWLEDWSGAVCRHRCDGQTDVKNDAPCSCDPDNQTCKPTSRLGVIITEVEGIGIFRLETHGWAAAQEISGAIEILRLVQNRGAMVPARLLLEQRQQKKINDKGDFETFNFAVPVLDLNLSVAALTGGIVTPRLESGVIPIAAPINELPSIADQVEAIAVPVERPKRSNSAAPLPATGVAPRATTDDRTPGGASTKSVRRLFAILNGSKTIPKDDDGRHAWAREALNLLEDAPVSFNDLDQKSITHLNDVAEGKTPLYADVAPKTDVEPKTEYDEYGDEKF